MAFQKRQKAGQPIMSLDFGNLTPKQLEFMKADTFYVCYGGA